MTTDDRFSDDDHELTRRADEQAMTKQAEEVRQRRGGGWLLLGLLVLGFGIWAITDGYGPLPALAGVVCLGHGVAVLRRERTGLGVAQHPRASAVCLRMRRPTLRRGMLVMFPVMLPTVIPGASGCVATEKV